MNDILRLLTGIKPASWIKLSLYSILIGVIYHSAIRYLILIDWAREDYSHSYLIPIVILYIIWEKRDALIAIPSEPSWLGLAPFIFGLFLYWLGELGGEFFTLYISLWFVLIGLLWMHMGWKKIKTISFGLFMFLTMFPFPNFINTKVLVNLRLISSQLGVAFLQLCGMSAYREGNIIDLGFTQLQVVDACSGLRYVIPLFVISLLLSYWFRAAFWKRIILVLSSIPLAVAVNSFRIATTGILYSFWGSEVAEGFFHDFSGWLIFMFTMPVLLLEMWILNMIGAPIPKETLNVGEGANSPQQDEGLAIVRQPLLKGILQPVFLLAVVLMVGTLVSSKSIEFRDKVPIKKPLDQFPLALDDWKGERQAMEQQFIDALHFSDYVMVDYRNPKGQNISFYVAYYESQRKGEGTHSPETCLPGSGWEFERSGLVSLHTGKGQFMQVNRAFMIKGDVKQLVYFWFPQRGRILTSLYQVKLYSFWDALIKKRTDGALVRVITPLTGNESVETAEERLIDFVKLLNPQLEKFIP